jgi:hypothetical protein
LRRLILPLQPEQLEFFSLRFSPKLKMGARG